MNIKLIRPLRITAFTALLFCSAFLSWAQSYKGTVQADITLEDGSPLPGTAVTLSADTFARTFLSDAKGQVRFVGLTPDNYTLKAIFTGFQTVIKTNITVDTGANVKLTIIMMPSMDDIEMIVTETIPVADSDKVGTGATLTIDELTLLPQARDPWAVLDTVPGFQTDRINTGGDQSGQQSVFVSKGDDGTNSAWMIDGVEFTDHAAEGSSQSYLDFGAFEQIGFTTSGGNVTTGSSGAIINLVTKQGTNEHHGSMRLIFADQDFQSSNLPEGIQGNEVVETFEKGFEIGGPLIKDRFWYWGSFHQNTIDNRVIDGSNDRTRLENLNLKLHGNITDSTRFTVFYTNGDKQKEGRGAGNNRAPETTFNQTGPTPIAKFEVSQLIGQNTEIQLIYGRVDGGFQLTPQVSPNTIQPVFNRALNRWENSFLSLNFSRPSRQYELRGDTYLALGNSENELSYGLKYKNAWAISNESWGSNGGTNIRIDDWSSFGLPSFFFAHRDSFAGTELDSSSAWVKDTITLNNLTMELGLRYNISDSSNMPSTSVQANPLFPEAVPGLTYQGDQPRFEYKTLAPQIGATYTFGNENQYLVRGSYRKYYDDISITEAATTNAAGRSWIQGYAQDFNNDGVYDANELGFARDENGDVIPYRGNEDDQDPYRFPTVGIDEDNPASATSENNIDPNLKPPEVDEFVLGGEWSITPGFSIAATYTHRQRKNMHWNLTQLGDGRLLSRDDYVPSHTLTGINPVTGEPYSVEYFTLSQEASDLADSFGGTYLTNRPDYSRNYQGIELTATKRLANKWMMRSNVSWSEWTLDIGPNGITDPTPTPTRDNVDGSVVAIQSAGSGDRGDVFPGTARWTASVSGLYQLPWDLAISGVFTAREGYLAPLFITSQEFTDEAGRPADVPFSIGELDTMRNDDLINLNLKLSKVFSIGATKVDLAVEIFNVFNDDTVLQRDRSVGIHASNGNVNQDFFERVRDGSDQTIGQYFDTFRRIDEYRSPRLARFSATINF